MRQLQGHRHAVRAVAYAPGSTPLLASAGDDQVIRLWDPLRAQEVATLPGRGGVTTLAFSPDGKSLAVGTRAGFVYIYDLATQLRSAETATWLGPVVDATFTADGRTLLFALRSQEYDSETRRLWCWDRDPPHAPQRLDWQGELEAAAFNPSRDLFALAGQHRGIEFWEVGRSQPGPNLWMPARVRTMSFAPPAGERLAVASGRVVELIDANQRKRTLTCRGHRGDVRALAFSPDGLRLLSGGADRSVRLWHVPTGHEMAAWDWQLGAINAVAWSPDGMTAAVGGDKPTAVVWDVDDG